MAEPVIYVSGPVQLRCALGAAEPADNLGHTREGVTVEFQESYDDVFTDDLGPDAFRDRVLIGRRVFIDCELHSFDRTVLENLMWLFDTAGQRARIGQKVSDLDGAGNTIYLGLESETDVQDFVFSRVAPIRISQRFGSRHTRVQVRLEAIIDASDLFWDNTAIVAALTGTDAPEVTGAHLVKMDSTELGQTADGSELVIEYLYDNVAIDEKGPESTREKVVTGQRVTWNGELHAYDKAAIEDLFGQYQTAPNYGKLQGIGSLASDFSKALDLETVIAPGGQNWNFPIVTLDGNPRHLFSARHSVIGPLSLVALPNDSGVYYTRTVAT